MIDPKYSVYISYVPSRSNGQQLVNISGVTQSMHTYSSPFFQAVMPEVKIWATGSTYGDALSNLLLIATASSTPEPGLPPL
jgi:hypothetical protein